MKRWEEILEIQILFKQGYSKKRIARELGISINTVRKHLKKEAYSTYPRRQRQPSSLKLDPYRPYIGTRVKQAHPAWLPATVIFNEIKAQGYAGGLSILRYYLRHLKPARIAEPIVRFETAPGKQMQVDWAEFRKAPNRLAAFVATLGYSRASYVEFVNNEKLATLIRCHERAFDFFGGVTSQVLYDNMKTIILERNTYGEGKHRFQPGFWDFAKHYHFIPKVCQPYRAQTKGKVERFIGYLRYSFYLPLLSKTKAAGGLLDVNSANYHVQKWLNEVANQRIHGTTKEVPSHLLLSEQAYLQVLPPPYLLNHHSALPPNPTMGQMLFLSEKGGLDMIQHPLEEYEQLLNRGDV